MTSSTLSSSSSTIKFIISDSDNNSKSTLDASNEKNLKYENEEKELYQQINDNKVQVNFFFF